MNIKVKVLNPSLRQPLPERKKPGDLGFDLYLPEAVYLGPGEQKAVGLNIQLELPEGWGALIRERSSTAACSVCTIAGVIDNGYRGEVKVRLVNLGEEWVYFTAGERVAQLVPIPVFPGLVEEVNGELSSTSRGVGGFGSTGRW